MPDLAELLTMARRVPPLPGALCKGHGDDFDLEDPNDPRMASAVRTCRRCPALADCRQWLAGLPPAARPTGVVAGRLVRPYRPPDRNRPQVRPSPKPRQPSMSDRCTQWLAERLADGPAEVALIAAEARRLGWSRSLAYAARTRLGLLTTGGTSRDDPAVWRLPDGEPQPEEEA